MPKALRTRIRSVEGHRRRSRFIQPPISLQIRPGHARGKSRRGNAAVHHLFDLALGQRDVPQARFIDRPIEETILVVVPEGSDAKLRRGRIVIDRPRRREPPLWLSIDVEFDIRPVIDARVMPPLSRGRAGEAGNAVPGILGHLLRFQPEDRIAALESQPIARLRRSVVLGEAGHRRSIDDAVRPGPAFDGHRRGRAKRRARAACEIIVRPVEIQGVARPRSIGG
ncbi:MAG: hypothetical protein BWZ10_02656 [candidate division BRC1 bacterium ADurb.BinA364]|nr:MAG: hypothetical protein BWZ10_02656 [candidate division BRC1 bacterium ADurb.BinA364]